MKIRVVLRPEYRRENGETYVESSKVEEFVGEEISWKVMEGNDFSMSYLVITDDEGKQEIGRFPSGTYLFVRTVEEPDDDVPDYTS